MTDEHHPTMLAAGWLAVRNIAGRVEYWQDPFADWHRWDDAEARLHYQTGDRPSVPRIRRPEQVTNGGNPAISRKAKETSC